MEIEERDKNTGKHRKIDSAQNDHSVNEEQTACSDQQPVACAGVAVGASVVHGQATAAKEMRKTGSKERRKPGSRCLQHVNAKTESVLHTFPQCLNHTNARPQEQESGSEKRGKRSVRE
jgi:hypothetical protein